MIERWMDRQIMIYHLLAPSPHPWVSKIPVGTEARIWEFKIQVFCELQKPEIQSLEPSLMPSMACICRKVVSRARARY